MPTPATDAMSMALGRRLSPGLWIAAVAEVAVAVLVAMIILRTGQTSSPTGHSESGTAGAHPHHPAELRWELWVIAVAAVTAAALVWWLVTRARILAVVAALGLVGLATSEPVRLTVRQSHLVGMAALEVLLVAVPLLVIATPQRTPTTGSGQSRPWTAGVIVAVALNSALLIGLHLPAVHGADTQLGMAPLWLVPLVVAIGLLYWAAVLRTGGRVRLTVRRRALIIGQEVAAILGLAALLRPSPHMLHANPLGLSPTVDQRLGGVLMLIACAAVTLPLVKHLTKAQTSQRLRTEQHVH